MRRKEVSSTEIERFSCSETPRRGRAEPGWGDVSGPFGAKHDGATGQRIRSALVVEVSLVARSLYRWQDQRVDDLPYKFGIDRLSADDAQHPHCRYDVGCQ